MTNNGKKVYLKDMGSNETLTIPDNFMSISILNSGTGELTLTSTYAPTGFTTGTVAENESVCFDNYGGSMYREIKVTTPVGGACKVRYII